MAGDNDNLNVKWSAWEPFEGLRKEYRYIVQITVCGRTYSGAANGDMRDKLPEIIGTFHPEIIFPNIGRIEVRLRRRYVPIDPIPEVVTYYYSSSKTPVLGNPDAATDTANAIREELKLYQAAVLRSMFPAVRDGPSLAARRAGMLLTGTDWKSDESNDAAETIEQALGIKR